MTPGATRLYFYARSWLILSLCAVALLTLAIGSTRADPGSDDQIHESARSGITTEQVRTIPLSELHDLMTERSRERAYERRRNTDGPKGDVVSISINPDWLFTQAQQRIISRRIAGFVKHADASALNEIIWLCISLSTVIEPSEQFFENAAARLHDNDPMVARSIGQIIPLASHPDRSEQHLARLIELAENAPTPTHRAAIMVAIQYIKAAAYQPSPHDARVVAQSKTIILDTESTEQDRINAWITLQQTFGAPIAAAEFAEFRFAEGTLHEKRLAILTLNSLCSIYENPDPDSRARARPIAMRVLLRAIEHEDTFISSAAAGACRHMTEHTAPLVPALITMLDHPDPNIVWIALSALGDIGEPAESSVPKIRALYKRFPEDQHEAMDDALYLITKQGPKPDWYDRFIQQRNEAMGHETPAP